MDYQKRKYPMKNRTELRYALAFQAGIIGRKDSALAGKIKQLLEATRNKGNTTIPLLQEALKLVRRSPYAKKGGNA
jgi:hypothetical protein